MKIRPEYALRAVMFGRLGRGGHLQARDVIVSGEGGHRATGITVTDVKQNANAQWTRTVAFEGAEYATVNEAIAAFEARRASGGGA